MLLYLELVLGIQLFERLFFFSEFFFEFLYFFLSLVQVVKRIGQFFLAIFFSVLEVIVQLDNLVFGLFELFSKSGLSFFAVNDFLVLAFDVFLQFF